METQRDLDESAIGLSERADNQMQSVLSRIREIFASSPEVLSALDTSQQAFESYRTSQVDLVSAASGGTSAALLRTAIYRKLTTDRDAQLRSFLMDTKPDEADEAIEKQ